MHYLTDQRTNLPLIRFWFPANPPTPVLPVDYEVLDAGLAWLTEHGLMAIPETVGRLILRVFFQDFTDNYYQAQVDTLSCQAIDGAAQFELPYPR